MILEPVKVTGSGRPVLYPGEVERALLDRVRGAAAARHLRAFLTSFSPHPAHIACAQADLAFMGRGGLPGQLDEAYKVPAACRAVLLKLKICGLAPGIAAWLAPNTVSLRVTQAGYIILTNQRLVWMDAAAAPAAGRSCCLSAHSVTSLAKRPAGLLSSKSKLELTIRTAQDGRPVAAAAAAAGSGQLTIKCKDAIDAFASILADVIRSPMPAPPQSAHSAGRPDNLISPSRLAELPQAAPAPVQQPAQPDEQLVKQIMEMVSLACYLAQLKPMIRRAAAPAPSLLCRAAHHAPLSLLESLHVPG